MKTFHLRASIIFDAESVEDAMRSIGEYFLSRANWMAGDGDEDEEAPGLEPRHSEISLEPVTSP